MLAYIAAPWIRHGYYLDFSEKEFGHRSSSSQVSEPWPVLAVLGLVFQPALERFLSWITSKFGTPMVHQFIMLFSWTEPRNFLEHETYETKSIGMNRPIHRRTANIAYNLNISEFSPVLFIDLNRIILSMTIPLKYWVRHPAFSGWMTARFFGNFTEVSNDQLNQLNCLVVWNMTFIFYFIYGM